MFLFDIRFKNLEFYRHEQFTQIHPLKLDGIPSDYER